MKKYLVVFLISLACIGHAQNKYTDSLKTRLTSTHEAIEQFDIINKISENIVVFQTGSIDSASCIQMLQIAQKLNSDSLLAICYNWIGSYFASNQGDNTMGLEYYFKAIPLAEKAKDKRRISSLYFDISLVYFNIQNNEEAVRNIRKGGENLPARSSPMYDYMLVQYQRGMARYFLSVKQPDSSLKYCLALQETSRRLKSTLFEYSAMYLNGSAYAQIGDMEMAELYFKKANAITNAVMFNSSKLGFYFHYIPFLLSNNKIKEALEQARQLWDLGLVYNNNNLKLAGAGYMRQAFDSLHQADSAYYFSRQEADVNALIFSQNNINKIQALAFDEKIRLLEEADKLADETAQRNRNVQFALIGFGIISFLILFLLLSRSFITNTKVISFLGVVALLLVFEFLNLLLHPFLERVTHHSPVLMLLALVGIASLLVPLHHNLQKWATEKLVEKNKQVRLAAAKKTIEQLEKEQ